MNLEVAIVVAAVILAGSIAYGSWCIAAELSRLSSLAEVFSNAFETGHRWVSEKEFKNYLEPDPSPLIADGYTYTTHLPPWKNPSVVEVFAWHLERLTDLLSERLPHPPDLNP